MSDWPSSMLPYMLATYAPAIVLHVSYMHTEIHVYMMLVMQRNCCAPWFSHAYAMSREHDASHAQELLRDMIFT